MAVVAPLTPRPWGTIYEALPLLCDVFEKAADRCISNSSDAIITVQHESEPAWTHMHAPTGGSMMTICGTAPRAMARIQLNLLYRFSKPARR
jgi:hypothetical protein